MWNNISTQVNYAEYPNQKYIDEMKSSNNNNNNKTRAGANKVKETKNFLKFICSRFGLNLVASISVVAWNDGKRAE